MVWKIFMTEERGMEKEREEDKKRLYKSFLGRTLLGKDILCQYNIHA